MAVHQSHSIRLLHPGRDVPLAMKHAPDVDVIRPFDIKHQIRIPGKRPGAQARQIKLMAVPRRSSGRVPADVRVCLLQRGDHAQGGLRGVLGDVVRQGIINILLGPLTRDDRLDAHALWRVLEDGGCVAFSTRALSFSKYGEETGLPGFDVAPANSKLLKLRRS